MILGGRIVGVCGLLVHVKPQSKAIFCIYFIFLLRYSAVKNRKRVVGLLCSSTAHSALQQSWEYGCCALLCRCETASTIRVYCAAPESRARHVLVYQDLAARVLKLMGGD